MDCRTILESRAAKGDAEDVIKLQLGIAVKCNNLPVSQTKDEGHLHCLFLEAKERRNATSGRNLLLGRESPSASSYAGISPLAC